MLSFRDLHSGMRYWAEAFAENTTRAAIRARATQMTDFMVPIDNSCYESVSEDFMSCVCCGHGGGLFIGRGPWRARSLQSLIVALN
jgi:hypothetical protein